MSRQPTYLDYFCQTDHRLPVMAFCALSHSQKDGNGGWAWLLQAQGKNEVLLYSGSTQVSDIREVSYAALSALGTYLGFPAQALLLMPNQTASYILKSEMPEAWRNAIYKNFDRDDPKKSTFIIGPDGLADWQGFVSLQAVASETRRASIKDCCRILERCPSCGEVVLNGRCGCQSDYLFFPTFTVPVSRKHMPNLIKKHDLANWPSRFTIDYRRKMKSCPKCGKALVPVADCNIAWKCASCDSEYDSGMKLATRLEQTAEQVPPKIIQQADAASLPGRLLANISRLYPGVWDLVDEIRAENRDASGKLSWDADIFLPSGYWRAIQDHYERQNGVPATAERFYQLMMGGAWRPTQDIISFDPAFYDALIATPLEGKLPTEVLSRFPAWCVYFVAPGLALDGEIYDGFFAMLDESKGDRHLCLYFLSHDKEYFVQPIRLGNLESQKDLLTVEPSVLAALNLILYAFSHGYAPCKTAATEASS